MPSSPHRFSSTHTAIYTRYILTTLTGRPVNSDSSQRSTGLNMLWNDNERKTTIEAATQPQEENVLELGKDVPRVPSSDGSRGAFAHHPLPVRQRKNQAAKCPSRAIRTTGYRQANRRAKPEVRFTQTKTSLMGHQFLPRPGPRPPPKSQSYLIQSLFGDSVLAVPHKPQRTSVGAVSPPSLEPSGELAINSMLPHNPAQLDAVSRPSPPMQ